MRRTTPHGTAALAVAAVALLLTGCGAQSGDGGGGGGGRSGSGGTVAPSKKASSEAADCVSRVELTAADNNRVICVAKGGQVRLTLDGTKERPWQPVAVAGHGLKAANPGFVILPGDAVAAYDAVDPGSSTLTSSRPLCAQSGTPGQVSCQGVARWRVTVRVR